MNDASGPHWFCSYEQILDWDFVRSARFNKFKSFVTDVPRSLPSTNLLKTRVFAHRNSKLMLQLQVLQHLLVPAFAASFERGEGEQLIGGPPMPDRDFPDNVISVFINRVIDPENPFGTSDAVRILLLQFSCLLVEQASPHIHDAANKWGLNSARLGSSRLNLTLWQLSFHGFPAPDLPQGRKILSCLFGWLVSPAVLLNHHTGG